MSNAPIDDDDTIFHDDLDLAAAEAEPAGPSLLTRMVLEALGTFLLVALALGVALFTSAFSETRITVGAAFGFSLWVIIVAIGRTTGGHVNPAVTIAAWVAGRFPGRDVAPYILAQVIGATAGGATLWALISANPNVADGRQLMNTVAIGFGEHSPTQFGLGAGLIAEVLGTAVFVGVILAATSARSTRNLAPVSIGIALFLMIMWTIPFTNAALNPARATGVAFFSDTWALTQLWAWWLGPLVGAAIAGLLFRAFGPEEDLLSAQREAAVVEEIEVVEIIEER